MVSSPPRNLGQRDAIRRSWAGHQPTFFVLGLEGLDISEQLVTAQTLFSSILFYYSILEKLDGPAVSALGVRSQKLSNVGQS
jgi:hypothetical protein